MGILDQHVDKIITEDQKFIQRSSSRMSFLKDFQKQQKTKQSWVKNRVTNMFAIKKWHKSFAGRAFHRKLGNWLATHNFIPKAGDSIGRSKNESDEYCIICEHWLNMPVDILFDVLTETKLFNCGAVSRGAYELLHYAHTADQVQAIKQIGFDLKKFGYTAKKFRSDPALTANDPVGVFATEASQWVDQTRPYVIFTIDGANILTVNKRNLVQEVGFAGKKLSSLLLKNNIQVVNSDGEFIILDPTVIRIKRVSLGK